MPITKQITTPAGNVLGSYGVVTQVFMTYTQANPVVLAIGCTVTLWASPQAFTAGLPAVAVYRYPISVALKPEDDPLAIAETALMNVPDRGNFITNDPLQQTPNNNPWTPGWTSATSIAAAPAPTPTPTPATTPPTLQ